MATASSPALISSTRTSQVGDVGPPLPVLPRPPQAAGLGAEPGPGAGLRGCPTGTSRGTFCTLVPLMKKGESSFPEICSFLGAGGM